MSSGRRLSSLRSGYARLGTGSVSRIRLEGIGETEMTLPMWYIRNTIYPYGARPPKRPNITWVEPTEETRRHRGHFTPVGPVFFAKGNLEEHEYQFFIGKAWEQSTMGTCRCCNR